MGTPVQIDYYTDVLCVWAWIAQRRVEEIIDRWGAEVSVSYRFVDVFGDTASKIGGKWAGRGGYAGFSEHVAQSSAPYETAPVNPAGFATVKCFCGRAGSALPCAKVRDGAPSAKIPVRAAIAVLAADILLITPAPYRCMPAPSYSRDSHGID